MSRLALLFSITLAFTCSISRAQDDYPDTLSAGSAKDGKYNIALGFGVEQLQEGKVVTFRYQTWYVQCVNPDDISGESLPFNTWCSVSRIVMDKYSANPETRMINAHNHYISEGTLKLTHADFPNGKLDFTLVLTDRSEIQVMIRMKRWQDSLFLTSFKAIGIARGRLSDSMEAVEYRIPPYSYTVNIPIEMTGLKTEADKRRDDFEQSLSAADRAILKAKGPSLFDSDKLTKAFPDSKEVNRGQKEFTPAHLVTLKEVMRSAIEEWLATSGMSEDGKTKSRRFFLNIVEGVK